MSAVSSVIKHRPVVDVPLAKNEATSGYINNVKLKSKGSFSSTLHNIQDVPEHLQYNPYIIHGYRPQSNIKQCCSSLFYFHNETVNIYTHGLAAITCLFCIPFSSPSAFHINPVLYCLHCIGCLSPFVGSTLYHLFMCHHSGARTYNYLLELDMCGIWAINAFGGVTAIKTTLFCSPYIGNICIFLYAAVAVLLLYFIHIARNVKERFFPLLVFGVVRYLFLAVRGLRLWHQQPSGSLVAVVFYILMDQAALFGGILNVTRFPERYFPGKFDFYFNSHNIMHVLVSLCPVLLHWGTMLDFAWMESSQCNH